MNPAFFGIVLNALGSVFLIFTPIVAGYGGGTKPVRSWSWRLGWGLLLVGYIVQAIAAYSH